MIQATALILGAVIVAGLTFVIGLALGLLTGACLRGFAKHGFHVDGVESVCTTRED